MAVVVDSGPIEATHKLYEVPKEKWRQLMWIRRDYLHIRLTHDCGCLVEFIDDAETMYRDLGFQSVRDMVRDGYDLSPAEVDVAREWLRLNPPDGDLPFQRVLDRAAAYRAADEKVKADRRPGGRPPKTFDTSDGDVKGFAPTGNSVSYALQKLRDERPDLHSRVLAGELTANAAMVEAGFRKPHRDPFPGLTRLLRAWDSATEDERSKFLVRLANKKETNDV
jgi:hypothetical protein